MLRKLVNIISGCTCEVASGQKLAFESVKIALTNVGGHHPVFGLNRTKRRKDRFALCSS